jgi:hypothetical protein
MFGNNVLRGICACKKLKREESEKYYRLYNSAGLFMQRLRWAGHVVWIDETRSTKSCGKI